MVIFSLISVLNMQDISHIIGLCLFIQISKYRLCKFERVFSRLFSVHGGFEPIVSSAIDFLRNFENVNTMKSIVLYYLAQVFRPQSNAIKNKKQCIPDGS
jgi:hypothetical protein